MPAWPGAAEEPERRQLLEVDGAYVGFRHELARNAIRSSLPAVVRRRLHGAILEALLAGNADPADIIHHAEAAGADDVVGEYALVAARRAAALESNPRGLLALPRAATSFRLARTRRRRCSKSWHVRHLVAGRRRLRRDRARDRISAVSVRESPDVAAGPVRVHWSRARRPRAERRP